MPQPSKTHLVVIPTYNTGLRVVDTVRKAAQMWNPVWIVIDGSTDGSAEKLNDLAKEIAHIRVLSIDKN